MAADTLNCTNPANVTSCFGPLLVVDNNVFIMVYELRGRLFGTILSTALFGTFTICTSITVLLIIRNLKLRKTRWATWYTFATIGMFTSTSIYWAFILRDTFTVAGITTSAVTNLNPVINSLQDCISDAGGACNASVSELSPNDVAVDLAISRLTTHDIVLEYCVGTAALTTNIVISDAIVLGRVYVLWQGSRLVCLVFITLLLATVATSIASTTHACPGFGNGSGVWLNPSVETTGVGSLVGPAAGTLGGSFFEGDHFGLAASVLSLATNALSTCFVGYRAWEHRALVRGNGLRSFLGRSQVSRALTLLVESGAVYSAIWIFVVAYQFITSSSYSSGHAAAAMHPYSSAYREFTVGWEAFTEGGLVIVVAIYPTIIMLLAGLNRSECDNIASHRGNGNGQTGDAAAMSVIFRGSVLVPAQSLNFPGADGRNSARQRASSDEAASEPSLAELNTSADCSSERGFPGSVRSVAPTRR